MKSFKIPFMMMLLPFLSVSPGAISDNPFPEDKRLPQVAIATLTPEPIKIDTTFKLVEALIQVEKESNVDALYLVDSFGALYSEQISYLAKKYKS